MLTVTDTIRINAGLSEVYDCFWNPEYWPRLTDHVKQIEMLQWNGMHQRFKMLVESNGKQFLMETEREGVLNSSISYRQTKPPPFLQRHHGRWDFVANGEGVSVTLTHDVVIDKEKALELLPVSTFIEAERLIGENLKRNGALTMTAVKRYVERAWSPRISQQV
jgi:aromatase